MVTYTGGNENSGQPRPPAVPLQELLDTLDGPPSTGGRRRCGEHPLQAFDPRNLDPARPFSFDRQPLAGALAAAGRRASRRRTLPDSCCRRPRRRRELEELVAFRRSR